jgi:hypothetical protein
MVRARSLGWLTRAGGHRDQLGCAASGRWRCQAFAGSVEVQRARLWARQARVSQAGRLETSVGDQIVLLEDCLD